MADESHADDGAIFLFWGFVRRRRMTQDPRFTRDVLATVAGMRAALDLFATEGDD
jgi:hypothetical protein